MNKSRDAHARQATGQPVGLGMTDTRGVNDELTRIPPARRRRMALVLAPLGVVLLVAGALAVAGPGAAWKLVGLLVCVLAVGLLGVAWGLVRSASLTDAMAAERRLDEAIIAASGGCGSVCGSAGPDGSAGGCGASCLTRAR